MTADLLLSAEGDQNRVLGCTDLAMERTFSIPLGSNTNKLYFVFRRAPVVGFMVKTRNQLVCQFGTTYDPLEIQIYKRCQNEFETYK